MEKNISSTIGPKPIKYLEINLTSKVQENNKLLTEGQKTSPEQMESTSAFQDRMTYYHKNINPFQKYINSMLS